MVGSGCCPWRCCWRSAVPTPCASPSRGKAMRCWCCWWPWPGGGVVPNDLWPMEWWRRWRASPTSTVCFSCFRQPPGMGQAGAGVWRELPCWGPSQPWDGSSIPRIICSVPAPAAGSAHRTSPCWRSPWLGLWGSGPCPSCCCWWCSSGGCSVGAGCNRCHGDGTVCWTAVRFCPPP